MVHNSNLNETNEWLSRPWGFITTAAETLRCLWVPVQEAQPAFHLHLVQLHAKLEMSSPMFFYFSHPLLRHAIHIEMLELAECVAHWAPNQQQ